MAPELPEPDRSSERLVESAETSVAPQPEFMRVVKSEDLFKGDRIICIEHGGAIYRLQITARGKLILQK